MVKLNDEDDAAADEDFDNVVPFETMDNMYYTLTNDDYRELNWQRCVYI